MKNKNSAARCIVVLLVIAIVCVATLGVLNDVLYVAPDMSAFSKAMQGKYEEASTEKVTLTSGKIELVATGDISFGRKVVGIMALGNKFGKSDSFSIAVVINLENDTVVGVYQVKDGSTGGYTYDETILQSLVGKSITSDFIDNSNFLTTGATNSSNAAKLALQAVAEYYSIVFAK